jgi:hypothetical protein
MKKRSERTRRQGAQSSGGRRSYEWKIFNAQAPKNKQYPTAKIQSPKRLEFDDWLLKFIWDLDFDVWSFFV